ncbi:unnamed protein product [Bursaphelenchus xylophilus]|uniref:(pine wood nematode) hypothetical protein n=1 Tax=Bursaphelenchus xylophilus TaxID=6326 RepID=A0A1I7SAN2_BURXY|nr:unnamed protein product [Bursaphelenchus xylophilus]CAG9079142.1 unnamed protein product [Bursaphelenchus xylophilus]
MWPDKAPRDPANQGNFVSNTIDSFFRYLRNIQRQPVPMQIGIGATGGIVTGYVFTRTSKFFAAILGSTLLILQFFNYRGYIKLNKSQFQQDLDDISDNLRAQFGATRSAVPSSRELDDFVTKNAYLFTGFIGGSLIGYGFA